MAKVSIQLESTTTTGVAKVKSFTDINPNATSEQLIAFTQGINALTTNQYVATNRIEKLNCDSEIVPADTRPTPVITLDKQIEAQYADSDSLTFSYTGDGDFTITNLYKGREFTCGLDNGGNKKIAIGKASVVWPENSPQVGERICTIVISETDNYKGTTKDIFFA